MSAALQRAETAVVAVALGLAVIATQAGGSAMAAVMGLLGASAGTLHILRTRKTVVPAWLWALLALAGWAAVSALWSPHPVPGGLALLWSPPALVLWGVVLYTLAARAIVSAGRRAPDRMQAGALGVAGGVLLACAVNVASDFAPVLPFHPLPPGGDPAVRHDDIARQVSRGVCVAVLLAAPVALGLRSWTGGRVAVAAAVVGAATLLACAVALRLWVAPLALAVCAAAALLAWRAPGAGLRAAFALAGASVLLAPLLGWLSAATGDELKSALPFSWEQRVEGWAYVWARILDAPVAGHGFDAARSMTDTFTIRGFEWPYVALHPHNAGLHIWVETGVIGAGLATLAVAMMGRRALAWAGVDRARSSALAGLVVAATVISAVSFGVWQEWWWASVFLAVALLPLMLRDYEA